MTQIKSDSVLRRETATLYRGRPLLVELHPGFMLVREKGRREGGYSIDYRAVYEAAAKIHARQEVNRGK